MKPPFFWLSRLLLGFGGVWLLVLVGVEIGNGTAEAPPWAFIGLLGSVYAAVLAQLIFEAGWRAASPPAQDTLQ
jgi:hypothetical protein